MVYIGIDPGAGGGIAVIKQLKAIRRYDPIHVAVKMPASERDIVDFLDQYNPVLELGGVKAVLEHVWSMPGQGHSGAFSFGVNVGTCRTALTAARIPFDQVIPRTWQKALGISYPKGATDVEKKNITKRRAQQLFPVITVTHAIADALLIAEYCRRIERGSVKPPAKR